MYLCVCVYYLFLWGTVLGGKDHRDEDRLESNTLLWKNEIWDVGKSAPLRCVNRENITYLGWSLEALKQSRGRMSRRAYLIYLGLEGRQSTLTATSWAGAGEFLSQRHVIMQGCVWAAGAEIRGWVRQRQGAQAQLRARVSELFCWESIRELCFSSHFLPVILNEEPGALAQGLLVPV